jgi:uncharacterized protein DUF4124
MALRVKALFLAILLLASGPAAAQLFKCVDARGRTHYTDKPLPGCKGEDKMRPPAQPQSAPLLPPQTQKSAAQKQAEKKKAKPKADFAWHNPKQHAAFCKGLRQQQDTLKRANAGEFREQRLGQVQQELTTNNCP